MSILIILTRLSYKLCLMLVLSLVIWILFISNFTIGRNTGIFRNIYTRVHLLCLFWCNRSLLICIALVRSCTNSVTLSWTFYSCLSSRQSYLSYLSISFFWSSISKCVTCASSSYLLFQMLVTLLSDYFPAHWGTCNPDRSPFLI